MPATPRKFGITPEQVAEIRAASANRGDYDYNDIEVPGAYEATLVNVSDHVSKRTNKTMWKFSFEVMNCPFDEYVSFSDAARWKLLEVVAALGFDVDTYGLDEFDPNVYIGTKVGAQIDWQTDPDLLEEGAPNYREIKELFSLEGITAEPTDEEEPEAL